MHILMVEDDKSVAEMMKLFFAKENWKVTVVLDGIEAVTEFKNNVSKYDLITLDLNLPKKDGMEVAKEIRSISKEIPIIILSARDSETDQILGLGIGADEYVTKPFSPLALIARIKALYRRTHLKSELDKKSEGIDFDVVTKHVKISQNRREVFVDGKLVAGLTPKEFDLLIAMAQKPKQVFSRDKLLELVWGYEFFGEERTVDTHIKKLRQKLENVGPQMIQTVWGVGYKFDDSEV